MWFWVGDDISKQHGALHSFSAFLILSIINMYVAFYSQELNRIMLHGVLPSGNRSRMDWNMIRRR